MIKQQKKKNENEKKSKLLLMLQHSSNKLTKKRLDDDIKKSRRNSSKINRSKKSLMLIEKLHIMNNPEKKILDSEGIQRALVRIAHEILEGNRGTHDIALAGIRTRGVFLAKRLQKQIQEIEHVEIPMGVIDITLYRDDLEEIGPLPVVRETEIGFDVDKKIIVLVDDVLYTGRTVRAAIDAVLDFGRPKAIQLATLIDRGHRELPIKADYVGKNIPTSINEEVILRLQENDSVDEVVVVERKMK